MSPRVAVVTGSNKGIGYATVQGLAKSFDGDVFLTSRDQKRGLEALESLKKDFKNVKYHQLDIDDQKSVERLRDMIAIDYGGLDVLVNNAGMAFKNAATEPFGYQAEHTLKTNYFNTKRACDILFPILNPGARVANVSSIAGWLANMIGNDEAGQKLKAELASDDLEVERLDALMKEFVDLAKTGTHQSKGWPNSTYRVSKIGLSALTRIQQRKFDAEGKDIVVNHLHPGYVDTDMTSHKGPRTIEEGARASIFAALLPPKTEIRGKYIWEDCSLKDWVNGEK